MPAAARLTDPIGHSPTMSWLLKGLLIGAAIAVAGVAIVGTGGLAAVAMVGAGAAMGAGLGEAMSTMSFAGKEVTGAIAMAGSPNVFVNKLAAARAHVDMVACSKHPGPIPIATGSGQVFINGMPAARVDDKTGCSAVITKGSGNVYIGGGTVQTDTINPEDLVPGWVHGALLVVGVGSAIILAGPVVAVGGLVGAFAGGYGGSWVGGKIFGEGSDGQKWSAIAGSFLGGYLGAKIAPGAWASRGGSPAETVPSESVSAKPSLPAKASPEPTPPKASTPGSEVAKSADSALPIKSVESSLEKVADLRQSMDIGAKRNIAFAEYVINGEKGELVGVSGNANRPGTVGVPESRRFETIATGNNTRMLDSEVKILEHLSARLEPDATGTLHLFSELPLCVSCSKVVPQFQEAFPGIKVIVTHGPGR